ncbi:MAG TPA: BPSS1780 family membrane protein [Burkholderiales bacterium]|nr:BPSS1780 family membrane protein [Burkholderiales bacterium]
MQARVVSAGRGARWLGEGWRLFRVAPLAWLAAVFGYWILMSVVSVLPFIGAAAAAILVPAFSVGFMALARAAGRKAPLELSLLFDGFRHEVRAQITLGVFYLLCLALLLGASTLADGGALAQWLLTGHHPDADVLYSEAFFAALVVTAMLYMPVMLAFWFAPPLVAWHSTGAVKALFFSFAASLMNWRAFLGYGAVTAVVTLVVPLVVLTALAWVGEGGRVPAATFVLPLMILLLPTLFASFYVSYRDVFGYDAAP